MPTSKGNTDLTSAISLPFSRFGDLDTLCPRAPLLNHSSNYPKDYPENYPNKCSNNCSENSPFHALPPMQLSQKTILNAPTRIMPMVTAAVSLLNCVLWLGDMGRTSSGDGRRVTDAKRRMALSAGAGWRMANRANTCPPKGQAQVQVWQSNLRQSQGGGTTSASCFPVARQQDTRTEPLF